MGECGIRGGYSEVVNMDPQVKAMLLKSISAKLCPTVIGQVIQGMLTEGEEASVQLTSFHQTVLLLCINKTFLIF